MAKIDKLVERFLTKPRDLTWDEMVSILSHFGFSEIRTGKTGGSRRKFANSKKNIISLHKPHPGNIVKVYAIREVINALSQFGKL